MRKLVLFGVIRSYIAWKHFRIILYLRISYVILKCAFVEREFYDEDCGMVFIAQQTHWFIRTISKVLSLVSDFMEAKTKCFVLIKKTIDPWLWIIIDRNKSWLSVKGRLSHMVYWLLSISYGLFGKLKILLNQLLVLSIITCCSFCSPKWFPLRLYRCYFFIAIAFSVGLPLSGTDQRSSGVSSKQSNWKETDKLILLLNRLRKGKGNPAQDKTREGKTKAANNKNEGMEEGRADG